MLARKPSFKSVQNMVIYSSCQVLICHFYLTQPTYISTLSGQNTAGLSKVRTEVAQSIHPPIFLTAYPARVKGMLEHIPGATGQDAGYNQDRLPVIRLEQRGRQPPTFPSKPMDK